MKLNNLIQGITRQETHETLAVEFKQRVITGVDVTATKLPINIYSMWTQTITQMHRRVTKTWQVVMHITHR